MTIPPPVRAAAVLLVPALVAVAWFAAPPSAAGPAGPAGPRQPWAGSKVVGSPEPPPPYRAARVFPNVKFDQPLFVGRCPGSTRLFFIERRGGLHSVDASNPDAKADVFFDLRNEVTTLPADAKEVESIYALAFHPDFETNRYCYVCYTMAPKDRKVKGLKDGTRVSRFEVTKSDPPRVIPASEQVVITWVQGGHNGCDLHFGPDRMLYVSTGDSTNPNPPDVLNTGQDCSDLLSSILRIDVDHQDPGLNYAVPKDNPFVGRKGVRGEIWAFGLRNPWRMSFDRQTGDLWVGDVGWELWEMVHKVEKGGNYGWSIKEGPQPIKPNQPVGPNPVITPPVIELPHTIAASVNGGYVYRGKKFPELVGAYVFGDWETRKLWAARIENGRVKEMPEITRPTVRSVAFGEDHAGEIFFVDYDQGTVHTLEREDGTAGVNKNFPTTLAATGLFASVKDHTPAAGVLPFTPAAQQWADHATAEHWLALPGTSTIKLYPEGKPIPGNVYWHNFRMHYPKDAVLLKTLSLETEKGNPASRRRVETQLLHYDGVDWRGYSFAWRDDQSDADLVPADGAERDFAVKDPAFAGGVRHQAWSFGSRTQCLQCHSAWNGYTMAFNPAQLNHDVGVNGSKRNLLTALTEAGYVTRTDLTDTPFEPFNAATIRTEPKLYDPHDPAAGTVEQRARSYLHANCGHCHRFNGGGAVQVQLHMDASAKDMKAFDVAPQSGDFGLPDAKLIAPGDPHRSVVYYRMSKFGRGRMPHLGSELPDDAGLALVADWIRSLGGSKSADPPADPDHPEKALASPLSALPLARTVGKGGLPPAVRDNLLSVVAKQPAGGAVRDLFEGYLPTDGKGRRLGANARPAAVLSLAGDAKRGEALFWTESVRCGACHKVGDRGNMVGPELTAIGKTRARADLLESLLEPSRRVEPQFVAHVVRTVDEKTLTGLLVKRDEKQLVLRDATNKDHVIPAEEVEQVQPSRLSLMPDGLLAPLTPQEAADLLEYLVTRK